MVGRGHAQRPSTDAASLSDVLFGRNPVRALLKGGGRRTDEVAVLSGAAGPLAEVVALARRAGVKVSYRTRDQLTAIAGSPHHQGVVARVASAEYLDLSALQQIPMERGEPAFFLALDQVRGPGLRRRDRRRGPPLGGRPLGLALPGPRWRRGGSAAPGRARLRRPAVHSHGGPDRVAECLGGRGRPLLRGGPSAGGRGQNVL